MTTKTVLFLCTGNYYRSRFAEILFNWLAAPACPDYVAESRGLGTDLGGNQGPISSYALAGLEERRIELASVPRDPLPLLIEDLEQATCIVGLYETEHRPLLLLRFPEWVDRVEYWHVPDLDKATPAVALASIEHQVRSLLDRLDCAGSLDNSRKSL